jgi:hypothetical protein
VKPSAKIETLCDGHSEESFSRLIDEIMALGYDEKTAGDFAVFIGDTPIQDEQGNIIVMQDGQVVARLNLKSFAD